MKRRQRIWLGIALLHLFLVVCGAAGWPLFSSDSTAGKTLRAYGSLSGADNGYGFFAPGVAAQLRPRFQLEDQAGNVWEDTLEATLSHEASLRLGGAIGMAAYPDLRPDLAASWAATMLGRHPSAVRVTVIIEIMYLPTMEQTKVGEAVEWLQLFEGTFERNAGGS